MQTLRYGEHATCYDVVETARLSTRILIHVRPGGTVLVEAPINVDPAQITAAVQKRARWIFANLGESGQARAFALPREYVGGETHFYLGRRYRLKVRAERGLASSVKLVRGCIEVRAPIDDPAAIKRRLKIWYRTRSIEYFNRRLIDLVSAIDWLPSPPPMKIVAMNRQWGSCSPSGSINLNPGLIRAPRHCIDYVLVHELCHLKEHNHSKRFYALLERHSPNWARTKAELDRLAELLLVE